MERRMIEQRKHMRLPIEMPVEIKIHDGSLRKGLTKNISFGGMLVEFSDNSEIIPGKDYELFLVLHEGEDGLSIHLRCNIVHIAAFGTGIQFKTIDIAHYQHFKNLMVYNCEDPEKMLEEVMKNPGLIIDE